MAFESVIFERGDIVEHVNYRTGMACGPLIGEVVSSNITTTTVAIDHHNSNDYWDSHYRSMAAPDNTQNWVKISDSKEYAKKLEAQLIKDTADYYHFLTGE